MEELVLSIMCDEIPFLLTEFSVPPNPVVVQSQRKETEVYINYKLIGLLVQASY